MRDESSLERFQPSSADPWDREKAAHLARRAGFGATPSELDELVALGLEGAVAELLDFPESDPVLERAIEEEGSPLLEYPPEGEMGGPRVGNLRSWWIHRLAYGRHPAQEKLTLFWHHHFACQQSEELGPALLLRQNQLFRRLAGADFRELLRAIARDPAMLVFLDGRNNVRERPNENWARELMELFTLGIDRYTQRDVVEIARVFTGWGLTQEAEGRFEFHPERHDPGDKQVLGRVIRGRAGATGVDEGDELCALLLDQPSAAPFLARKLLRWYVEDDPAAEFCEAFAQCLRAHGWSIREALRVLLCSRAFYAPERRLALYKTPVDFVISTVRELEIQNAHLLGFEQTLRSLGMDLFHPPSVAGWELGPGWIHAGSVLLRARFAERIAGLPHSSHKLSGAGALDLERLSANAVTGDALVQALARRLFACELAEARARELGAQVEARAGTDAHMRARAALQSVLAQPEFALA